MNPLGASLGRFREILTEVPKVRLAHRGSHNHAPVRAHGTQRPPLGCSSNHIRLFRRSSNHIRLFRRSSNHIRLFACTTQEALNLWSTRALCGQALVVRGLKQCTGYSMIKQSWTSPRSTSSRAVSRGERQRGVLGAGEVAHLGAHGVVSPREVVRVQVMDDLRVVRGTPRTRYPR